MSDANNSITVKILGKEYKIKCPPEKVAELQESAHYLDKMMQEIRDSGAVLSVDRIAVLAALNISHEMLILKKQKHSYIELMGRRIQDVQRKIELALVTEQPVEL